MNEISTIKDIFQEDSFMESFEKIDKYIFENTIKEPKKLSSFKKKKITKEFINKYKSKYKFLKHIDTDKDMSFAWMDEEKIVGILSITDKIIKERVRRHEIWITAIEVSQEYKGYKLGKQILNYAVKKEKARFLSVRKTNKIALYMYKKRGFKTYNETDYMYFMKL